MLRRSHLFVLLSFVLALIVQFLTGAAVIHADDPIGEHLDSSANYCQSGVPCEPYLPAALRSRRGASAPLRKGALGHLEQPKSQLAKGGPDAFGYKWNDTVPFQWIDPTTGVDTGMSGSGDGKWVGPIKLPFKFPYYDKKFKKIFISAAGFITFNAPNNPDSQSAIPHPFPPNRVIAPYWTPTHIPNTGRVYYQSIGTKPNRVFVVTWYDIRGGEPSDSVGSNEVYRFQVLLYEKGTIDFQYDRMTYNSTYWCGSNGIEDSLGVDGLAYMDYCAMAPSHKTVRFTRPKPAPRVGISPAYQGSFAVPGQTSTFNVRIRNIGEKGTDTFDLVPISNTPSDVYKEDGITPLLDTDGDGTIDTGPLEQGKSVTVVVKQYMPEYATSGIKHSINLVATSSLNTEKSATASLTAIVPIAFVQALRNYQDGAMSLDVVAPEGESIVKVTPDNYAAIIPSVVRAENGNYLYAWQHKTCLDASCSHEMYELEYSLRDPNGQELTPIRKSKSLGVPTNSSYQFNQGLGALPNGKFGVSFVEQFFDPNSGWNDNVWLTIVTAAGKTKQKVRLTQNEQYGYSLYYYLPHVVGTTDNRFVVVWQQQKYVNGAWVSEIYYAVLNSNGEIIKPPALYLAAGGGSDFYTPTALALADGNVLISFIGYNAQNERGDLYIGLIDSQGGTVKGPSNLTNDASYDWSSPDAAQFGSDSILIAWNTWNGLTPELRYVVLNKFLDKVVIPTVLDNPAATTGDGPPSVLTTSDGIGIVTWSDYYSTARRNLYYGWIQGEANFPTIFQTSKKRIDTSNSGHGNAPR